MTQPDFSGTFEGRFVDDDNLRESGRVWLEFDNGGGEMSLPIDPEATNVKNAALAEISASGDNAVQAVGVAKNSAVQDVHTARDSSVQSVSTAGTSAVGAINTARDSAVTAVNTAKSDALTDIEVEVTRAEDAADRAESAVNDGVSDGAVTLAKLAQDVKDQIGAKAEMSEVEQALEAKPDPDTVAMMISQAIAGLVGSAPQALDTVYELAAYLTDPGVASGLVQQLAGKAPTTHTHTSAQISDKRDGVWSGSTDDGRLIATSGGGYIQTSKYATQQDHVTNKKFVNDEDDKRILKSGTAATVWSGTQAQYDALTNAVKNAAGFIAVITA